MIQKCADYITALLGIDSSSSSEVYDIILVLIIISISFFIGFIAKRIFFPIIRRIVSRTKTTWVNYVLSDEVLNSLGMLVPVILMSVFAVMFFGPEGDPDRKFWISLGFRLLNVYIIAMGIRLFCALISSFDKITANNKRLKTRPMAGIFQMMKLLVIFVGIILIIGELIDKSPAKLIAGLGAAATILMLLFKDTLVGFVAGVQLSVNDMLRPGDWIQMPKCGVDGEVVEVSITTVKVRNWDNTIITVPPYLLVSDAFQNWRNMSESGGRRMRRSLRIDFNTIEFASDSLKRSLIESGLSGQGIMKRSVTNIVLYMEYLETYLKGHPSVNGAMTVLVRQLDSGSEGLPVEIYCFCSDTSWIEYEHFQSEIYSHAVAVLPAFKLKAYQRSNSVGNIENS